MVSVYDRSKATAIRLLTKYGQECTWRRRTAGTLVDVMEPWRKPADVIVEETVRIVFNIDELEDRQFVHYLKNTELQRGLVNGLMAPVDFELAQKDTLLRGSTEFVVANFDEFNPGGVLIYHIVEFKK